MKYAAEIYLSAEFKQREQKHRHIYVIYWTLRPVTDL
jgi:hypothetical protein